MADRLIPLAEVEQIAGIRRSTIYARIKAGDFPQQRVLSRGCVRWRLSEIEAWMDALPAGGVAALDGVGA